MKVPSKEGKISKRNRRVFADQTKSWKRRSSCSCHFFAGCHKVPLLLPVFSIWCSSGDTGERRQAEALQHTESSTQPSASGSGQTRQLHWSLADTIPGFMASIKERPVGDGVNGTSTPSGDLENRRGQVGLGGEAERRRVVQCCKCHCCSSNKGCIGRWKLLWSSSPLHVNNESAPILIFWNLQFQYFLAMFS